MNQQTQSNLDMSTQQYDAVTHLPGEGSSNIVRLSHQQPPQEVMMTEYQGDRIEIKQQNNHRNIKT